MDDIKHTYSYECGDNKKYRIVHRTNGEVVASLGEESPEPDLEKALKTWILSPNLRKTVEGWIKTQKKPKAAKTKAKGQGTRGGPVTTSRLSE